jgi:FtsZ-interacting cell division protein ZipA
MKKIFNFVLIAGASIAAIVAILFASSKKTGAKKKFKEDVKDSKKALEVTKTKTSKVEADKKVTKAKLTNAKAKTTKVKAKKKPTTKAKTTAKNFKAKYKSKKK